MKPQQITRRVSVGLPGNLPRYLSGYRRSPGTRRPDGCRRSRCGRTRHVTPSVPPLVRRSQARGQGAPVNRALAGKYWPRHCGDPSEPGESCGTGMRFTVEGSPEYRDREVS